VGENNLVSTSCSPYIISQKKRGVPSGNLLGNNGCSIRWVEEPSIAKTGNIIKYEFFSGKIAFKFTVGSGSLQINRQGGLILSIPAPIKSIKHDQLHRLIRLIHRPTDKIHWIDSSTER
jgi:hypothetical protein